MKLESGGAFLSWGRSRPLLCRLLCALNSISCPLAPVGSPPTLLHPGGAKGCLFDLSPSAQRALPGLGPGASEQSGAAMALEVPVEADRPGSYPCLGARSLSPSSWLESALAGEVG